MENYPKYEVWGGYINDFGESDEPKHLEDCFSFSEAQQAAMEYTTNPNMFAFVRTKD